MKVTSRSEEQGFVPGRGEVRSVTHKRGGRLIPPKDSAIKVVGNKS